MSGKPLALHAASPAELKARLDADRRGAPYLLFRQEGAQRLVELEGAKDRVTIGRQEACDVSLPEDPSVSRVHAVLERIGVEWTLVDDGSSRNGTFVNGQRIHGRQRLRNGDLVQVGATHVAFCAPRGRTTSETVPTGQLPVVLSGAQRRVLIELCRPLAEGGFASPPSNAEIARELYLSAETVKTHMHALFQAFDLGDVPHQQKRARLAQVAIERGVVTHADLAPVS